MMADDDLISATPAAPALVEAFAVVKAWAMREIVSDGCIDPAMREPGCLSCDTLHFLEAMQAELDDGASA